MKLLITGASGLVGYSLCQSSKKHGIETVGTYSERKIDKDFFQLNIADKNQVSELIRKIKPDVVIHTAALTHVDHCENHRKEAWGINVEGTRNVAEGCLEIGAKLVYMSTDYVFDGNSGPYTEEAIPSPMNYYGLTKFEGEKLTSSVPGHLIVRTTWVFDCGVDEKNFAIRLVNNLKSNQSVRVPNDQIANPTLASNLADAMMELVLKNKTGIYNIIGLTRLSKYEFAVNLAKAFNFDENLIVGVTSEELGQPAKRPKIAGLIPGKTQKELNSTKLVDLNDAIKIFKEKVMEKWKKN